MNNPLKDLPFYEHLNPLIFFIIFRNSAEKIEY